MSAERWTFRGAQTTRPLPEDDPRIDALDAPARERLGAAWEKRARAELGAAVVFTMVAREVLATQAPPVVHWLASRAASDELRHVAICRQVAARYLDRPVPWPVAPPISEPTFGPIPTEFNRAFHVVLNCCLNETIANAFLHRCRERADVPLVHAALRELLVDEVEHARIGWAYVALPGVLSRLRVPLGAALPVLLRVVRRAWHERAADYPEEPPAGHGSLPPAEIRALVDQCLREVVVPGFARLGVGIDAALSELDEVIRPASGEAGGPSHLSEVDALG